MNVLRCTKDNHELLLWLNRAMRQTSWNERLARLVLNHSQDLGQLLDECRKTGHRDIEYEDLTVLSYNGREDKYERQYLKLTVFEDLCNGAFDSINRILFRRLACASRFSTLLLARNVGSTRAASSHF